MTSSYSVPDFHRAAFELRKILDEQLAEVARRRADHDRQVAEVRGQHDEALGQLTRHLLPDLSAAACERAARVTAFTDLLGGEPERRLTAERAQLETELVTIAADPTYSQRDVRRVRATTELEEINEFRAPLIETLQRAAHERLETLLATGYDTASYTGRWWRASYYADWKAGDEIVERFPTKASFAQVRDEVMAARQALAEYDARAGTLNTELTAIAGLEQRHAAATDRLARLDELHLAEWRNQLGLHVALVDPAGLADRLAGEAGADLLLKTVVGTKKKIEYLVEIARNQLDPVEQQVRDEIAKLQKDRIKYSRPKNSWQQFPADRFEKRFRNRGPRFAKHWHRYDRAYQTVYVFDGYHRASFYSDFLWWDLMTDGQLDGNFIPEVAEFHHHHPHYRWDGGELADDRAAAAAALADQGADDTDGAAAFDPS